MMIDIYQLDAFTHKLFSGNPAAVCLLEKWIPEDVMQHIAAENNLAETAFLVPKDGLYEIRWFTPSHEVELCGHATLASAYVLMNELQVSAGNKIHFYSHFSGDLHVRKLENGLFELDFPTDYCQEQPIPDVIRRSFNLMPRECYKGKTDYLLVYDTQADIENLSPDLKLLSMADGRGVVATAPGRDADFVSRFFAPQIGIDEDPVTGSSHTMLTPYWQKHLNKTKLEAAQLSKRGGRLTCTFQDDRTLIAGAVVLYLKGKIHTE
ncbi:MAG: PhzF family phenazine biosynthesis protein [Bacteroidales bacterium]|nr:PhzF family phenazine biosynthesis protein [Bacteroidales bacterium]